MQMWLMGDTATSDVVRHWDQRSKQTLGLVRIDGSAYRYLGSDGSNGAAEMVQQRVEIFPTRTQFVFQDPAKLVELNVTFLSTQFSKDYQRLSRPVSYVRHDVRSLDGKQHNVQLYFDMSAEHVVNDFSEQVTWGDMSISGSDLAGAWMGTEAQPVLELKGDQTNINWGYLYLASEVGDVHVASAATQRATFAKTGKLPVEKDTRMPRNCSDELPAIAVRRELLADAEGQHHTVIVAYDDRKSVSYYDEGQFSGYWTMTWPSIEAAIAAAALEELAMLQMSSRHDGELLEQLSSVGGEEYAQIAALAYRQTLAATKLVWNSHRQQMWNFLKEISTNGDMQTMDVIFPASPMFLYTNPELLRLLLLPILAYANNETGTSFSDRYSPHQIGTYPIADADTQSQEPMPMENTGNMFLMLLGLVRAKVEPAWLKPYYPMLKSWAEYLKSTLPFPALQLCTDDFTGKLANNTNLAAKGIVALEAFAELCKSLDESGCDAYSEGAHSFAKTWQQDALEGDHFKIAFQTDKSYSIKYNLVWQKLLAMSGPFDWSLVAPMEVKYYISKANKFGPPMDFRHSYVKLDWLSWAAAMADDELSFQALHRPIFDQANQTGCRVPLTDLFDTIDAACSYGKKAFVARPVTGGVFAKMLTSGRALLTSAEALII